MKLDRQGPVRPRPLVSGVKFRSMVRSSLSATMLALVLLLQSAGALELDAPALPIPTEDIPQDPADVTAAESVEEPTDEDIPECKAAIELRWVGYHADLLTSPRHTGGLLTTVQGLVHETTTVVQQVTSADVTYLLPAVDLTVVSDEVEVPAEVAVTWRELYLEWTQVQETTYLPLPDILPVIQETLAEADDVTETLAAMLPDDQAALLRASMAIAQDAVEIADDTTSPAGDEEAAREPVLTCLTGLPRVVPEHEPGHHSYRPFVPRGLDVAPPNRETVAIAVDSMYVIPVLAPGACVQELGALNMDDRHAHFGDELSEEMTQDALDAARLTTVALIDCTEDEGAQEVPVESGDDAAPVIPAPAAEESNDALSVDQAESEHAAGSFQWLWLLAVAAALVVGVVARHRLKRSK